MIKCITSTFTKVMFTACILSLFACSVSTVKDEIFTEVNPEVLLRDELISSSPLTSLNLSSNDILTLDDNIKNHLDKEIRPIPNKYKKINALNKFILNNIATGKSFQELRTKTATQTFYSKTANCLSYANLFIAAARYVELEANYHLVSVPPIWIQEKNSWILNHHINVLSGLDKPMISSFFLYDFSSSSEHHTLPQERKKYLFDINESYIDGIYSGKVIPDHTAYAYFYSNMAAEALVEDNLTVAYLYTKEAIKMDPRASNSWNTLGIIYSRLNQYELAEASYKYAFQVNSEELPALSNLSRLYARLGRHKQANEVSAIIHRHIEQNPYHHYSLALKSYKNEKFKQALKHIDSAIKLKKTDSRFHLAKAQSYVRLSKLKKAQQSLKDAYFYAAPENKERYYAKFENLDLMRKKQHESL